MRDSLLGLRPSQLSRDRNLGLIISSLDEDFVISRIIKVDVRVIRRSQRLRLITLTETIYQLFYFTLNEKNVSHVFVFTDRKQHKAREVDMVTSELECP